MFVSTHVAEIIVKLSVSPSTYYFLATYMKCPALGNI